MVKARRLSRYYEGFLARHGATEIAKAEKELIIFVSQQLRNKAV